jgi:hypothetical protein
MKKIIYTLLAITTFYACGAKEEKKEEKNEVAKEEVSKDTLMGIEFSKEGAMNVEEFMTAFAGKDSMEAKITGTVAEVCKKKGCWMTMDLGNGKTMRVSYDYKFLLPLNCDGLPIVINGMAYVDTISVADQKHYLEDANASKEEIDAITEPEINLSFLATGVILSNE